MRTMQHNSRANAGGRVHGTKHNDRNFDVEKADNIDIERSAGNVYWNVYNDPTMTFEQAELRFYEEMFGEQLRRTNEKYLQNGHPERCRTMAEWKMAKRNAPEETVMQIGKMEAHVDADTLMACHHEYDRRLNAWNEEHGKPFTTLTFALHVDEAVPHIQTRRVWHYTTDDGVMKIGQEKALAAAGVELPFPELPEGRKNNRKAAFDKMCRGMWLDILHEHGLDIEREAVPDGKHNRDKEKMIRDKYEALLEESADLRADVAEKKAEKDLLESEVKGYRELTVSIENVSKGGKQVLPGVTVIKTKELDALKEQAKAYTANKDELADVRQRSDALRAKEVEVEQKLTYLDKRIDEVNKSYNTQLNLNRLYRELQSENKKLTNVALELDEVNKSLNAELGDLRAGIGKLKENFNRELQSLKSRLVGAYKALTSVVKAVGMLKYDKEDGYKVDGLTKKQDRLIDGVAEYAAERAKAEGLHDLAGDMEKHIGISAEMQPHVEVKEDRKHNHDNHER